MTMQFIQSFNKYILRNYYEPVFMQDAWTIRIKKAEIIFVHLLLKSSGGDRKEIKQEQFTTWEAMWWGNWHGMRPQRRVT